MSSSTSTTGTQQVFMVYAPDYTDEGAPERRSKVRAQHLANAKGLHSSGFIKLGGALLDPESAAGSNAPPKMIGSMMLAQGESLAAVREKVETDIYWTAGVWDKERLLIMPFLQAPLAE